MASGVDQMFCSKMQVCVHSMEHWESVCADFLCHENKGIAGTLVLLSSCVTLFMLLLSSCVTSFDYQSIFGSCCCTLVMYVFLCQVIYVCHVCTFYKFQIQYFSLYIRNNH